MPETDITPIIEIAKEAGSEIMKIYNDDSLFNVVDYKADDSPLTIADKRSHEIIDKKLRELHPDIPILSEEGKDIPYEERKNWERFWLVDPLDGTKEFIKRNGEFTVNIALIEGKYPVLGVIYAPDLGLTYFARHGNGAYKMENNEMSLLEGPKRKDQDLTAVRSRSHASPGEETVYRKHNVTEFTSVGSSLKFCMVAEGKADLYYREGPTMEWDTAAGQSIVESCRLHVISHDTGERFEYNKENLLNPGFIVGRKYITAAG